MWKPNLEFLIDVIHGEECEGTSCSNCEAGQRATCDLVEYVGWELASQYGTPTDTGVEMENQAKDAAKKLLREVIGND